LIGAPTCVEPPPAAESAVIGDVPVGSARIITCANQCETCSIADTNCLTCEENRSPAPTCGCDVTHFENDDGDCVICDRVCKDCYPDASTCTECVGDYRVTPDCSCPDGMFDNGSDNCAWCHHRCTTCTDSEENCLTCADDREDDYPDCTCPLG
jgi:hypothetical protein